MLLHLRLILRLALIFIVFAVGITFAVVITFGGDTAVALLQNGIPNGTTNQKLVKLEECKVSTLFQSIRSRDWRPCFLWSFASNV